MTSIRQFSADSNKLAYAQAFSRTSTRHLDRSPRGARRRSLTLRFARRHSA